jgi:small-conductance mechanosensitive channel
MVKLITMKKNHKIILAILLCLTAAGIAGIVLTNLPANSSAPVQNPAAPGTLTTAIDEQYLDTAHDLSSLAASPNEVSLAEDILRAADHELDLQFAAALQASAKAPIPQTPQIKAIQTRIQKLQNALPAKVAEVESLTAAVKNARPAQRDELQAQLEMAEAQLDLLRENFGDAQEDLVRAGGDPHTRIQALVDAHNASNKVSATNLTASGEAPVAAGLVGKFSRWCALRQKASQVLAAQSAVYGGAAELARTHDKLDAQLETAQAQRKNEKAAAKIVPSAGQSAQPAAAVEAATAQAAVAISSLKQLAEDRQSLSLLDKRIEYLQEAGSDYEQWSALIKAEKFQALHALLVAAFGIVLTLLVMFLINRAAERFFSHVTLEVREKTTLQGVVRISVQAIAVMIVLVAIFGPPNQLSTVLGLAGAGLTVVLKDFIVSFLGWFVLMGRHGIHVGDWVEINGVRGEVIEISLLRTILLETGNWTDAGEPTGRQVGFLNQYAVDGYYFNFTTTGQWLWDELQVIIPRGQNPYPLIEQIRNIVGKEMEKHAQQAESEWQRVSQRYGVRAFSATPSISVRQTDTGVVVNVRYITKALDRAETRYKLNHAFVKLLNQGEDPGSEAPPVAVPKPA